MPVRNMKLSLCAFGCLIAVVAFAASATEKRVALVIGNADYQHASRLANPVNDATDIGAALGRLGFAVTKLENAGKSAFERGLQMFAREAATSEVALVFYAGHGIEIDQRNFLVPVDARLASDRDVEFEAVPLDLGVAGGGFGGGAAAHRARCMPGQSVCCVDEAFRGDALHRARSRAG